MINDENGHGVDSYFYLAAMIIGSQIFQSQISLQSQISSGEGWGGNYVVYHKCHVQCALLDLKNSVGHQSHWRLRAALTKALPLRAALVAALPICQGDTAAKEEQK